MKKSYTQRLTFSLQLFCESSKDVFLAKKMDTHIKLYMRDQGKVFGQLRKLSEEEMERYFTPKNPSFEELSGKKVISTNRSVRKPKAQTPDS
jgi:hypothetical protein